MRGGGYFILLMQGPCLSCGSRSLFSWSSLVFSIESLDGDNELNMVLAYLKIQPRHLPRGTKKCIGRISITVIIPAGLGIGYLLKTN
jgi:hypothetical protein